MAVDRPAYHAARCECGAGVAGSMIADSRPWYACGTVAGRPCIALDPYPMAPAPSIAPVYAIENLTVPTERELDSIRGLVDAFTIATDD